MFGWFKVEADRASSSNRFGRDQHDGQTADCPRHVAPGRPVATFAPIHFVTSAQPDRNSNANRISPSLMAICAAVKADGFFTTTSRGGASADNQLCHGMDGRSVIALNQETSRPGPRERLEIDPNLDPLRKNPRFQKLVEARSDPRRISRGASSKRVEFLENAAPTAAS